MRTSRAIAATVVTLALSVALVGCGNADPAPSSGLPPVASPTTTSPASPPSDSPTAVTTSPSAPTTDARVPVYWAGDTAAGPLLYREFLPAAVPSGPAGRAIAALQLMLAGRPLDPDYRSLWPPALTVDQVTIDGATADVALSGPLTRQHRDADSIDVQQLVHTVTAAQSGVTEVAVTVNGSPLLPSAVGRAPAAEVLAPVWVIDPQQGATVGRPLRLSGSASVFEAQLRWEVLRDDTVVRAGGATATLGAPERGTWSVTVRGLPPGQYRVVAFDVSLQDGSRQFVDDKSVTLD